jgi:multidrug resistance protein, MATE family
MSVRREFGPMLRLATPLALAELGWMAAGIVDTVMAGPFGAAAVGAGSLGNMLFYPTAIAATGVMYGLDTLVAQSFGAGDEDDCRRSLVNGIWIAIGLTPVVIAVSLLMTPLLRMAGTNPQVLEQFAPYVAALQWGVLPLLVYTALRRYLQAVNVVKPITFTLLSANLVNVGGNFLLMYAMHMGLEGSGWSTSISRWYMCAVLVFVVLRRDPGFRLSRPSWPRLRRLFSLGLPVSGQITFEGAIFGAVTVMAARLDEIALAAHGIAVQVIATTYMVPLGISSAAAVRVGHALGRGDPNGARDSAWAAMAISGIFMGTASLAIWLAPDRIVYGFIADAGVVAAGVVLLRIAAFFELFDGWQVVASGALRGLGDTRSPMIAHLVGYWAIGMPIAWTLCFSYGWGAPGIWVGLTVALILIGIALTLTLLARQSKGILVGALAKLSPQARGK